MSQVAEVLDATGPNTPGHENVPRRIVVSDNVSHHSRGDVPADIRTAVRPVTQKLRAKAGVQVRAQQEATTRLLAFGSAAVVGVFLLLTRCSARGERRSRASRQRPARRLRRGGDGELVRVR